MYFTKAERQRLDQYGRSLPTRNAMQVAAEREEAYARGLQLKPEEANIMHTGQICQQADADLRTFIRNYREKGLPFQEAMGRSRRNVPVLTPEELAQVLALREEGMKHPEIGRVLGLEVWRCKRAAYLEAKRRKETAEA